MIQPEDMNNNMYEETGNENGLEAMSSLVSLDDFRIDYGYIMRKEDDLH